MTISLRKIPLRFPAQYSAQWFETWVREVLDKADVRSASGNGVTITSNGDSPATITNPAGVASILTVDSEPGLPESRQIAFTSEFTTTDGGALSTFSISITINGITDAMLRQSAGLSVIGRSANTTGSVADITAGTDGVLREKDGALGFGEIKESAVTNLVTDLAAKVPTSRTISTTSPLSGGGDLSADRTLSIPVLTTGTGAPATSPADGTLYLRTDGGLSTSLYMRIGGAWKVATLA